MSKNDVERRVEKLEGQSGVGDDVRIVMWEPDGEGGPGRIMRHRWAMKRGPDGRKHCVCVMEPEEAGEMAENGRR